MRYLYSSIMVMTLLVFISCHSSPVIYVDRDKALSEEEQQLVGFYDAFELSELLDEKGNPIPLEAVDADGNILPTICAAPKHCVQTVYSEEEAEKIVYVDNKYFLKFLRNHGLNRLLPDPGQSNSSLKNSSNAPFISDEKNFADYYGFRMILNEDRSFIRWQNHELAHTWQRGYWQVQNGYLEFQAVQSNSWAPDLGSYFREPIDTDAPDIGERNEFTFGPENAIDDYNSLTLRSIGNGWHYTRETIFQIKKNYLKHPELIGIYKDTFDSSQSFGKIWISEFDELTYENEKMGTYMRGKFEYGNQRFRIQIDRRKTGKPGDPPPPRERMYNKDRVASYASHRPYHLINLREIFQIICMDNECNYPTKYVVEDFYLTLTLDKREQGSWFLTRISDYSDRDGLNLGVFKKQ